MIELGPGADLFRLVGAFFWLLVLGALAAAVLVPRSLAGKVVAAAVVVGLFVAYPGRWAWERKQANDAFRAQRAKALAHYAERCKGAGEFIYRTVEGVEGVFVGEIPQYSAGDLKDQNAKNIYNRDDDGDYYIRSFLLGRNSKDVGVKGGHVDPANPLRDEQGRPVPEAIVRPGYRWIEGIDPKDGRRYRYTGAFEIQPGSVDFLRLYVKRHPPGDPPPRYAIERIDLSTSEDRALWVAGGALRVIDRQTGDILAERIGYMVDPGQGSTAGATSPWMAAVRHACPPFPKDGDFTGSRTPYYQTRLFVEKVLKTKGDEQ